MSEREGSQRERAWVPGGNAKRFRWAQRRRLRGRRDEGRATASYLRGAV